MINGLIVRLKRTGEENSISSIMSSVDDQMEFTRRDDDKWKIIRRAAEYAVLLRPRHDQMGFDYNLLFSFVTWRIEEEECG